jgi:hypothetical protein
MLVRVALTIRHLPIYAKEAQLRLEIKKTLGRACDAYLPLGFYFGRYEHQQTCLEIKLAHAPFDLEAKYESVHSSKRKTFLREKARPNLQSFHGHLEYMTKQT